LNEDEISRNKIGKNYLMISRKNPIYSQIRDIYEGSPDTVKEINDQPDGHGILNLFFSEILI